MSKAKKATKSATARAVHVKDADLEITGSQADYEAYLPAAQKLAASAIVPFRADPNLALHNLGIGVANVLAELANNKLAWVDISAIRSLPGIGLAVVFAATQIQTADPSGLAAQFALAYPLRALMLKAADALAEAGLLKRADVDKIKAGHGKLDAAQDLIALSALFTKNAAAIRGKHAITAAQIKQASTLGTALVGVLKPGRAKRSGTGPAVGTNERDRLWTLVVQGYDMLWRVGAYLFGKDLVDEKVPPLLSGRGGRPRKGAPAPVAPLPPPPATPPPAATSGVPTA